jgi:hypothetical protein
MTAIREEYPEKITSEINRILSVNLPRIKYYARLEGIYKDPEWEDKVSLRYLDTSQDIPTCNEKNLFNFGDLRITQKFIHLIKEVYPGKHVAVSGNFYYASTGFMGWHTNSDSPCDRVYITWASEGGKSFFRYRDDNGDIITDYDDPGITVRRFNIPENPPHLWHCVGSECDRLSFGFRLYETPRTS